MVDLTGKTAIITGAGQGVGFGIACAMSAAGANVVLGGRTLDKVENAATEIVARGGKAIAVACNVKSLGDMQATIDAALQAYGGLDLLVNNAQEVPLGTLDEVTDEAFTAGFESGPLATFRFMKLARPHLATRGGGVIVNMATSAGVRWDMAGYGPYGAVKQAIRVLGRAAASEWGSENIRVLTIAPHALSPGLQWWTENFPEEAAAFVKSIPLGRIGSLEGDIGAAVTALCGPEFAYLTGATIPLDGGQANFD
jgi:NAD(P)-dependent dehydrogenase (short-subunit alcohol dehydrogenase family)